MSPDSDRFTGLESAGDIFSGNDSVAMNAGFFPSRCSVDKGVTLSTC